MMTYLKEAAEAVRRSRHTLILLVQTEGVKVWAPRYGRLDREYLVPWDALVTAGSNPLLPAIANLEAELVS